MNFDLNENYNFTATEQPPFIPQEKYTQPTLIDKVINGVQKIYTAVNNPAVKEILTNPQTQQILSKITSNFNKQTNLQQLLPQKKQEPNQEEKNKEETNKEFQKYIESNLEIKEKMDNAILLQKQGFEMQQEVEQSFFEYKKNNNVVDFQQKKIIELENEKEQLKSTIEEMQTKMELIMQKIEEKPSFKRKKRGNK